MTAGVAWADFEFGEGSPWLGRLVQIAPQWSRRSIDSFRSPREALRWISTEERPVNAGRPVSSSQRIEPRPKTSHRSSSRSISPRACRGPCTRASQHRAGCGRRRCPSGCAPSERRLVVGLAAAASSPAPPGQDLGQAPVHHLHLAERADHHVRGLQVAVDHASGVGVGNRLADCSKIGQKPW